MKPSPLSRWYNAGGMDSEEFIRRQREKNRKVVRLVALITVIICLVWLPVALLWLY